MKSNLAQKHIVYTLILILAFAGMLGGQSLQSSPLPVDPQGDRLQLPSFAIFGLSTSGEIANVEKPINAKELEKFITELEKARAGKGVKKDDVAAHLLALRQMMEQRSRTSLL